MPANFPLVQKTYRNSHLEPAGENVSNWLGHLIGRISESLTNLCAKISEIASQIFACFKKNHLKAKAIAENSKTTSVPINVKVKPSNEAAVEPSVRTDTIVSATGPKKNKLPMGKVNISAMSKASLVPCPKEEVLKMQEKIAKTTHKPKLDLTFFDALSGHLPSQKLDCGEVSYYFSNPFYLNTGNLAVVAFVKIDDQVFPRVFYQSNSQGTWRAMPAATKNSGNLNRLGKGLSETDTQVPINVMMELYKLPRPAKKQIGGPLVRDLVKTGINFTETYKENVKLGDWAKIKEGAKTQFIKEGNFVPNPPDPFSIKMPEDRGLHPNFKEGCIKESKLNIPHYGEVTAKIFESSDKSIRYLFYEASDGKAFLAAAEQVGDNPINAFGIREKSPHLMNMDAPLLEYRNQIPAGYEPAVPSKYYESPKYSSNWNYVRELEIIRLYYSEQQRPLPDRI